jgi:hypothetical protein
MASEFEGYIDRIENGWLLGWTCMPAAPEDPIEIHVLIDGAPAGT